MKDEDIQNLLGGFATDTLTDRERELLFTAALNNQELFDAVQAELDRRGLKIRNAAEWGLRAFLLATNPAEARRLGITAA